MILAVIASKHGKCLPVLLESLRQYAPHWKVWTLTDHGFGTFGEAYQHAIEEGLKAHPEAERVVMLNDDCVLRPDTARIMEDEWNALTAMGEKIGLLVTRSDYVRGHQSIRFPGTTDDAINGFKWASEERRIKINVVIPIAAMFSRETFEKFPLPPITWGAEDVWCWDMHQAGYWHFIGCAYVHHVGGQTIGSDFNALHEDSRAWLKENRPMIYDGFYKGDGK